MVHTTTQTNPRQDGEPGAESTLRIFATEVANNSIITCSVEENLAIRTNGVLFRVQGISILSFQLSVRGFH